MLGDSSDTETESVDIVCQILVSTKGNGRLIQSGLQVDENTDPDTFKKENYSPICFYLDESKESLMEFMIPQLWQHKDNIYFSCRYGHPVYLT